MSVLNLRPRKLGSFEDYTISLSRTLTAAGAESILVFKELPPVSLLPAFEEAGAVLETKAFEPGMASAAALRSLIQRHRPDVVHLHFVNLLSLDVLAAGLQSGVQLVFSDHASYTSEERTALSLSLLRARKKLSSSLARCIIAPSNFVRDRLIYEGVAAAKIAMVHNGVDLERFRHPAAVNIREKYALGSGILVASISQLIPEKGIGHLIEAAAIVIRQGADIRFIHVGDGPFAQEFRAQVHSLGLESRFVFAGLLNLPEISAILSQCDVFTLPCLWGEAFALVILEALAAGKPAIVTRVGGNVEAVDDGRNGILIPPSDTQALANAILALYRDPEKRRSMAAESARRSAGFSIQRWVDQTIDIYSRITSES